MKALFGKIARLIKTKYGVKASKLNFLYKTVFIPVISYGFRVWRHRLRHLPVIKNIKRTQRKVLLNIMGTYCTPSHSVCDHREYACALEAAARS